MRIASTAGSEDFERSSKSEAPFKMATIHVPAYPDNP